MSGRLQNKIAIITGSSSGIGRAIALAFAREGASIVCSDIRETAIIQSIESTNLTTVQEVEKLGAKAIFVKCDITVAAEAESLVKKGVEEFGRVDIMVNNAGISFESGDPRPIWEYPEDWFDTTVAINLKGVFLGTKYAALQMRSQDPHPNGDRGWIINIASILGTNGTPGTVGYVASKHGVIGVTKTAAWDCAKDRIHVNAICPGYTGTNMTKPLFDKDTTKNWLESRHPFRGLGAPEDLAKAAVFLASEDAGWITGIGLPVDGGYTAM